MFHYAQRSDSATDHRPITHVIFDFDGTLSWLRHGWPDIMIDLFCDFVPTELQGFINFRNEIRRDVLRLNGKPSIHQITAFCERAGRLGINTPDRESLLRSYSVRLAAVVSERIQMLESAEAKPADFVIAGAFDLLAMLKARKLTLIILSGTIEADVKREAALLGLAPFFGKHILFAVLWRWSCGN
jgi:phosphoglycolate phosphatase